MSTLPVKYLPFSIKISGPMLIKKNLGVVVCSGEAETDRCKLHVPMRDPVSKRNKQNKHVNVTRGMTSQSVF